MAHLVFDWNVTQNADDPKSLYSILSHTGINKEEIMNNFNCFGYDFITIYYLLQRKANEISLIKSHTFYSGYDCVTIYYLLQRKAIGFHRCQCPEQEKENPQAALSSTWVCGSSDSPGCQPAAL